MSPREYLIVGMVLVITGLLVALWTVPVWHECRKQHSIAYCFATIAK